MVIKIYATLGEFAYENMGNFQVYTGKFRKINGRMRIYEHIKYGLYVHEAPAKRTGTLALQIGSNRLQYKYKTDKTLKGRDI